MANTWFEFKQFIVHQDKCGMKVSTDACIQGAIANQFLQSKTIVNALDIGTGTGLLALMLAQENTEATITALEIEEEAYFQSKFNFEKSPWSSRIKPIHQSVQDYSEHAFQTFDFIICNPPFFENHLRAEDSKRNLARHNDILTKQDLVHSMYNLLEEDGTSCVLLPTNEWDDFELLCKKSGFQLLHLVTVHPNPRKKANRKIGLFIKTRKHTSYTQEVLFVRDEYNIQTKELNALLFRYYDSIKKANI